jgi:hypothetical protein
MKISPAWKETNTRVFLATIIKEEHTLIDFRRAYLVLLIVAYLPHTATALRNRLSGSCISSGVGTFLITRAGVPTTTGYGGMSLVTLEPVRR